MKIDKISFDALEDAQKIDIEVQAELLKQKEILKLELELENKKHMDAIMENLAKSQMYNLEHQQPAATFNESKNIEKEGLRQTISNTKERIMMTLLIVIIVILAIGVTPSGAWYEALQTSYVETLVDIFKVGMIGFGSWLTYKLFKK